MTGMNSFDEVQAAMIKRVSARAQHNAPGPVNAEAEILDDLMARGCSREFAASCAAMEAKEND